MTDEADLVVVNSEYTANNKFRQFHFSNVNTNYQALRRAKLCFTDDLVPVYRPQWPGGRKCERRRAARKVEGMI